MVKGKEIMLDNRWVVPTGMANFPVNEVVRAPIPYMFVENLVNRINILCS
jgi:hypothetical protein